MKTFNVRMHGSNKIIQLCCEERAKQDLAKILQLSTTVAAFNVDGMKQVEDAKLTKYKSDLSDYGAELEFMRAFLVHGAQVGRSNAMLHNFRLFFDDCIQRKAEQLGFEFGSKYPRLDERQLQYFWKLLKDDNSTQMYKWGLLFKLADKCTIKLYRQGTMFIFSNKPEIRIGKYVFNHENKTWRTP